MSPDWSAKEEPVPYVRLDDPQSLNLYAYVLNHPTIGVDPDGHDFQMQANQNWIADHQITNSTEEQLQAAGLVRQSAQAQQNGAAGGGGCGFFCRVFHTDHVPDKLVINQGETENKGSYSLFHYQLNNKEGQKLSGGYGLEEHLWSDADAQNHMAIGHNSEGVFAPQNSQGEWKDAVGYSPQAAGQPSFSVYQTFSVSYKGTTTTLSTEFEHITVVNGSTYSNSVVDIKP
jgi:hypothetical protein